MKPEDVLALATTLYYKARWADEFSPENTSPQTFHAPSGDVEVDFMHQTLEESYYRGENFGVVRKGLQNSGAMWLILPDETYQSSGSCWNRGMHWNRSLRSTTGRTGKPGRYTCPAQV